ncbi:hypothetical protein [Flavobacterium psychrotrophum]|uniref:hypothetical protein n=1 Tax=Flavobacterium psychrotrophum TaxID=2294119 RepID=UPI000E31D9A8|nr:hypothetical protein [Flavobacterium psychrotrophum]
MKKIIILLFLTIITVTSCSNDEKIILSEKIASEVQQVIKLKNDSLIQAMMRSDLKIYKALGTDDFKKNIQSRTRNVSWAFRKQYTDGSYNIYDQYYIINGTKTKRSEIISADKGYTFKWTNVSKETYISMLKLPFVLQDYLLILQYVNDGSGKWLIHRMDITPVGRYGLTPFDFLEEAKKLEKKNFLLDAYFYTDTAIEWSKDIEGDIAYNIANEAQDYKKELAKILNKKYPFPIEVKEMKSRPLITDLTIKTAAEGMFPMIIYKTNLSDSISMVKEYEELRLIAPKIYPDMDFSKKYAVYVMTKNVPDGHGGAELKSHEFRYKKDIVK